MKTAVWDQLDRSVDFIDKFKRYSFFTILRLNKWIPVPDGHFYNLRVKLSRRGVNSKPRLFYGKINFVHLIFQRWIA